jgi:ubiquitin-activating enzyme E1
MSNFVTNNDDSRYSRQSYAIGKDVMVKLSEACVLVIGYNTLSQEIIKNLALQGFNSINIVNNKVLESNQKTGLYYMQDSDGKINLDSIRKLNPTISINEINVFDQSNEFVSNIIIRHDLIIITNSTYEDANSLNRICHKNSIPFIMTGCYGLMGYMFNDFGENFVVRDVDGKQYNYLILDELTEKTMSFRDKHELQDGDVLEITLTNNEILNLKVRRTINPVIVDFVNPIGLTKESIKSIIKKKIYIDHKFKTLKNNYNQIDAIIADFSVDFNRSNDLHELHRAYDSYFNVEGKTPDAWSNPDFDIFKSYLNDWELKSEDFKVLAKKFCFTIRGDVLPFASIIAGVVAHESIKAISHKYIPISQWYYLDYYDLITREEIDTVDNTRKNYRSNNKYEGLINVFGKKFVESIQKKVPFIVGSGAIGCELVKNLGMIGVKTIIITDNDRIEKSNLSRQFLFNDADIYKSKAATAASKIKQFNPDVNVIVFEQKVCSETEAIFNQDFHDQIDIYMLALDNNDARIYMDEQALKYEKPMLNSGTEGTLGNVQVIIPHLTESYGSTKDPEQKSTFPICTIKSFPYKPEHTIQWARELFETEFNSTPALIEKYRNISNLITTNESDIKQFYRQIFKYKNFESSVNGYFNILSSIYYDNFIRNIDELISEYANTENPNKKELKEGDRLPTHLNTSSETINQFMMCGFNILNQMFKTNYNYQQMGTINPIIFNQSIDNLIYDEVLGESTEIIKNIPQVYKVDFEKDDDSLGHVQFVTESANMRNEQYMIPKSDVYTTRKIAGNIIPAMITTTSLISGFQVMEYIKIIKFYRPNKHLDKSFDSDIDIYKNRFVNLDNNYIDGTNPPKPSTVMSNNVKISLWSKIRVNSDITINVIKQIEQILGTKIEFMTNGSKEIYDGDDIHYDKLDFNHKVDILVTINDNPVELKVYLI